MALSRVTGQLFDALAGHSDGWRVRLYALLILIALVLPSAGQAAPEKVRKPLDVIAIVRSAGRAVVLVVADGRSGSVQGTGFIISSDGTVVTNYHVIAGATHVQVKLTNGWLFSALGVVGFDEERDLALIKVAAPPLPFVILGDSDSLEPGEKVVAIGYPRGLENTVADGLVSSIREVRKGTKVIQTTTPASSGSSGSPLFNMQGEVVGVTTFKILKGENLNFAVAVNHLSEVARKEQLIPFASLVPTPEPSPQPTPPVFPSAALPQDATPDEVYKAALNDYTKGNYDLAINGFKTYLQLFPKTSLVGNAQYWLGETYYSQGKYPEAIQEFETVLRDYSNSNKVPSAMLKQGYAYLELGETARGTDVLRELITRFRGSREARLAQERLRQLHRQFPW